MILKELVLFSAPLWEFLLVGILVLIVVVMAIIYIRTLEKGRNEDRAAAIRSWHLLRQNRELLKRVVEHSSKADRYIQNLEQTNHNLTLQVCELKSRINYYENSTLVVTTK